MATSAINTTDHDSTWFRENIDHCDDYRLIEALWRYRPLDEIKEKIVKLINKEPINTSSWEHIDWYSLLEAALMEKDATIKQLECEGHL